MKLTFAPSFPKDGLSYLRNFSRGNTKKIIGIAGDSSVGKDSLAESIRFFVGRKKVAMLDGDNYHLWERNNENWKTFTHLNPTANNLGQLASHIELARDNRNFISPYYDHTTGEISNFKFSSSGDLIITQGLHSLNPNILGKLDLAIYMGMDEDCRVKLKMRRDVNIRNKNRKSTAAMIKKRNTDFRKFIEPQRLVSHIYFHLFKLSDQEKDFHLAFHISNSTIHKSVSKYFKENIYTEFYDDNLFEKQFLILNCNGITSASIIDIYENEPFLENTYFKPNMECVQRGSLGIMTLITLRMLLHEN